MKAALAVLAVFATFSQGLSDDDHEPMKAHMKKFREDIKVCMDEYEIPEDSFKKHLPIPDDKKCFWHCLFQKKGFMDAEGKVTLETFKEDQFMPPEMVHMHERCVDQMKETEACAKAKEIADCVRKEFEHEREKHMKGIRACIEEFDVPEDTLRNRLAVPEDKKCFYKCIAVQSDKMNDAGEFTIDEFKEKHNRAPAWMVKNLQDCAKTSEKEDPCDSAKELCECMRRKRESWRKKHV